MTARAFDAVVIGAGLSGLAAACYLAKEGKRVLVAEARNKIGGACESAALGEGFTVPIGAHALHALDPRMVKELKLAKRGLKFTTRDMALVGLGTGGRHVVIGRDIHDTVRNIAVHSKADAQAWPAFHDTLFALARAMRPLWWEASAPKPLSREMAEELERLKRVSAAAWLDSWFESDVLKATLAFDALSPFEPGSALTLVWRAAQEMCGLQSAVAWPTGGPAAVADALATVAKAAGVDIQTGAEVARIQLHDEAVAGVELASGGTVSAPLVLSSLPRRETLRRLAPSGAAGFETLATLPAQSAVGAAKVLFTLKSLPPFNGMSVPGTARFILADRPEVYAAAWSAARAGRLPDELTVEFVIPTHAEPSLAPLGQHILSAWVRPVPCVMDAAMKTALAAKLLSALDAHASGLARAVAATQVLSPDDIAKRYGHAEDGGADRLLNGNERIMTPIAGLYLCGAEPVAAPSGRAGRLAAALALGASR